MVVRPVAILLLVCAVGLLAACGGGGVSAPDGAVAQLAVPMPMAAAQSDSEIAITWSAVSGATHYKLYRSETSGGMYIQIGGEISVTRYLNDGLSANTSYYYQLEACNNGECSGRSPEVSATTAPPPPVLTPPAAPTTAMQSDSMISITWSAVAGATHYKLYRSTASGGPYTQVEEKITATSYVDSNLDADILYYYQLEVCNDNGCSGRSPEISTAITGPLGAGRDEIAAGLLGPVGIAFSGGRAYVVDDFLQKIISYAVGVGGSLGAGRDEIAAGLSSPRDIAFSGGRAYVVDSERDKIISYAVEADGSLGAGRDEITAGLSSPQGIAFSGGRGLCGGLRENHFLCGGGGRNIGRGARRDNDWFVLSAGHCVFGRPGLCGGLRKNHFLCGGGGRKFGRGA